MTALVRVTSLPKMAPQNPAVLRKAKQRLEELAERPRAASTGAPKAAAAPKTSTRATARDGGLFAFPGMGINDVDRALGGATGSTPPDQGLCVGNGFVLEMVNSAAQVFDILGQPVGDSFDLAPFFNFPAPTETSFSFASDPKCYFDQATGRFFATVLRVPVDAATGAITGSALGIAVSQSSDPRGAWNVFEVDLADNGENGTPNHAHCPCLGDQPLIGADTNGFYVTTNEFGLDPASPGFNGAQIYALDKHALVAGNLPSIVHLGNLVLADGIGFSIQPATTPSGNGSDDAGGTEYFLSSLDFTGTVDNRIALWSLSNTGSLVDAAPTVRLEHAVLRSEVYGQPPPAEQQSGPTPLRDCLAAGTCDALPGFMAANEIEHLETNDDRMNQTVFAGGRLWSALDTVVQMPSGPRAGIAIFSAEPRRLANGRLGGRMRKQGYVALDDADVMFPSIAMTEDGRGAVAFSLSGPHDFPSSAYARIANDKIGNVRLSGPGAAPLDDFSGYEPFGDGASRFGDYSAALLDGSTLWMANEAITSDCATFDCRDPFTNWGTVVSRLDLDDDVDN